MTPLLLVVAVAAVACSSGSSGGTAASPEPSPTVTTSPAPTLTTSSPKQLTQFYDQKLAWTSCNGSLQCATLTVPEDYSKPAGKTLGIAVIRQPAASNHAGSLIINPGGPGASGVDFVAQSASSIL